MERDALTELGICLKDTFAGQLGLRNRNESRGSYQKKKKKRIFLLKTLAAGTVLSPLYKVRNGGYSSWAKANLTPQ